MLQLAVSQVRSIHVYDFDNTCKGGPGLAARVELMPSSILESPSESTAMEWPDYWLSAGL